MQQADQDTLDGYYESGMYDACKMNELFDIARGRIELKGEERELQDGEYTLKVEECYSAIEIQHFCKNSLYQSHEQMSVPLGFGIFWEVIVPLVYEITYKIVWD